MTHSPNLQQVFIQRLNGHSETIHSPNLQQMFYSEGPHYSTASPTYSPPELYHPCHLVSFRMASRSHSSRCAAIAFTDSPHCRFLATVQTPYPVGQSAVCRCLLSTNCTYPTTGIWRLTPSSHKNRLIPLSPWKSPSILWPFSHVLRFRNTETGFRSNERLGSHDGGTMY
jgi:hypothetical protein